MKKSAKIGFIIAICALSLAVIGLGVVVYLDKTAMTSQNAALEGMYQRSFHELMDNVNSLENEINKLMVTKDPKSQQKSILVVKQQSSEAQSNISRLPVNSHSLDETTRFMNQLNGYFTTLLKYDGGSLDADAQSKMKEIGKSIDKIQAELNRISYEVSQGYSITDNIKNTKDINSFSLNFSSLQTDSVEYPSMIYDGPFSDSADKKQVRGLRSSETSEPDARKYAMEIFNTDNIQYMGETNGRFTTYDYKITFGKNATYAQITKKGKFLLTVSSNANAGENSISEENAKTIALEFMDELGLKDMQVVWSAAADGIAYINLAPVIDDVTMYPDLIKAKIDLVSGKLVGYEASSYAYNHTERDTQNASITVEQARDNVSDEIKIASHRLCIIPLEFGGEALAYEFEGTARGADYYVYIDAQNGGQIKIMRVIATTQGNLLN